MVHIGDSKLYLHAAYIGIHMLAPTSFGGSALSVGTHSVTTLISISTLLKSLPVLEMLCPGLCLAS